MLETKEKIIFALVRKNGQTFTELLQNAKTNHESLSRGLNTLKKENLIKQDDRLYYFSTKKKNPLLLSLNESYTMAKQLDGFIDKMEKTENPFPPCSKVINQTLKLQTLLKVERYTSPKLTKREKLEFDIFNDIFDAVLELLFKILLKDPRKTKNLKMVLFKTIFNQKLS